MTAAPHAERAGAHSVGDLAAAAPAAMAILLLSIASFSNGAFAVRSWAPIGIFLLAVVALAPHARTSRPALLFVGLFGGFAAWTLISTLWSGRPGAAFDGGARALLYAGLVAVPVCTLLTRQSALIAARLLGAFAAAVVIVTAAHLLAGDAAGQFLAGRLDAPVGYRNATAALFALAFWPLLSAGARRRSHPLLRASCLALAVTSLGLAFLTQSRGVMLGFLCGAIVALGLGPERLRRAWLALLSVAAAAVASPALLKPYDAFLASARTVPAAVDEAVGALALLAAVSFVVALLGSLLDGGLRISAGAERTLARGAGALLAVIALGAVVTGLAVAGNPVSLVERKAREFRDVDATVQGGTRLGSAGGQRYDLWRIAWRDFRDAPLIGSGEGAYPNRYYRERATDRNLSTPHSLALSVLGELGLVGGLLLGSSLGAAALALRRGWSSATREERRWASALAAAGAVALGQAAVDWLWLIPGVMGIGLLCLSTAVALVSRPPAPLEASPRGTRSWPVRAVAVVATCIVAVTFLSDTYVRRARAATDTEQRLSDARMAHDLNPFAPAPHYLQAGALEALGRTDDARRELGAALDLEPESFVTLGLLGDLETRAGRAALARRYYERALALNPRDTGLQQLAR